METKSIKANFNHNFPLKTLNQSFLISNGINHFQIADIEMVALHSLTYTSLKDLLPAPAILSPEHSRKDSWREIPIRDPLLQHAAWAYLKPMSAAGEPHDRSFAANLKDRCLGLFGCFGGFFNDVVVTGIKMLVSDDKH
ncbi:DNA-directed RNA polymerase subunit alpha like [Actinidia chinensis var. chinensis]|uniref:DNA-directed RNA polymerase subunit alpha like n=1 Tax=Actinidia chinensis var. chinensis TaxID=1590841 RepID=A0A2R6R6Z5_ACTCC|nr:DNA-directed RNA polymerase subunit alpha like [Actinidia chinensis var. chinensis]